MSSWKDYAYIDLGIREQIDDKTTYHGQAWYKPNGELHCCIGPKTSYTLRADGGLAVYHNGRKAW